MSTMDPRSRAEEAALLRQTYADAQGLVAELVRVAVTAVLSVPLEPAEAEAEVTAALAQSDGWVRYQSNARVRVKGVDRWRLSDRGTGAPTAPGRPLRAEWIVSGASSSRLMPDPRPGEASRGLFRILTLTERELGPGEAPSEAERCLLRLPRDILGQHGAGVLTYHVFWGLPPRGGDGELQQLQDRLARLT